jgi:hypothetical protein
VKAVVERLPQETAMTSQIRTFALAALVAIASASTMLHAQNTIRAQVDVPFSFDYGTNHFGRGTYLISMNGDNSLMVYNRDTRQTAMVVAKLQWRPATSKSSQVTFRKYGDRWFMEEVAIAGNETTVSVYPSKAERQAARELASRGGEATQVALALLPEGAFGK